jgi:hypothetical protein
MATAKDNYKGRDFTVFAEQILLEDAQGNLVGGQYYGSFRFSNQPGLVILSESVKEQGTHRTKLFPTEGAALEAAMQAVKDRIDGKK